MRTISAMRPAVLAAIFFVLAYDCAFIWQKLGGSYASEFGGHPDEAAHYVTGLMVRDYIAAGFPGSPMAYAESYYTHYPKIGLGVWPPFFYVVQSAWTLPFGVERLSILLLMAAVAALGALLIFASTRTQTGPWTAVLAALGWLSIPLVREQYGMVMAEGLSTVLMLAAALMLGNFLDRGHARHAISFGVFSGLAILTKGTGLALILVVPLAIVFARKWAVLKRPALWGGGAIAAVLAGPWTWKFKDLGKGGWLHPGPTWEFTIEALPYYLTKFAVAFGPVLFLLFLGGLLVVVRRPVRSPGRWATAAALIISVILFQSIAPVGLEARHLIPATAPAMMFVAVALGGLGEFVRARLPQSSAPRIQWILGVAALIAAGLIVFSCLPLRQKGFNGFAPLAETYVKTVKPTDPVLVSSDARGEGMFIAEVAMRDRRRPSFVVQRASKTLADSEWSGRGYRPRYRFEQELLGYFRTGKVKYLVVDESVPEEKRVEHHDTLKRTLEFESNYFWPLEQNGMERGGAVQVGSVRLFRLGQLESFGN